MLSCCEAKCIISASERTKAPCGLTFTETSCPPVVRDSTTRLSQWLCRYWPWTASSYSDGILKEGMRCSGTCLFVRLSHIIDHLKQNGKRNKVLHVLLRRFGSWCNALTVPWVSSTSIYCVHKHTMNLHSYEACLTLYRKQNMCLTIEYINLSPRTARTLPLMFWFGWTTTNPMEGVMLILIAWQSCSSGGQTRHWSPPTQRLDLSVQSVVYCQWHRRITVKAKDIHHR